MRTRRVPTRQVHYVPASSYHVRSPFAADVTRSPVIREDYVSQGDDGLPEGTHEGATAQNGFTALAYYRCSTCLGAAREDLLDEHVCPPEAIQEP